VAGRLKVTTTPATPTPDSSVTVTWRGSVKALAIGALWLSPPLMVKVYTGSCAKVAAGASSASRQAIKKIKDMLPKRTVTVLIVSSLGWPWNSAVGGGLNPRPASGDHLQQVGSRGCRRLPPRPHQYLVGFRVDADEQQPWLQMLALVD